MDRPVIADVEGRAASVVEAERSGAETELAAREAPANVPRMKNCLPLIGGNWCCWLDVASACGRSPAASGWPSRMSSTGSGERAPAGSIALIFGSVRIALIDHRALSPLTWSSAFCACATDSATAMPWVNTVPSPSSARYAPNLLPVSHCPAAAPSPTS
jgi:hypothetical protein